MSDQYKKLAAERAADDVTSGMRLGIGTGSTAEFFVHALARRVQDGLDVIGVPTSERTRELASSLGIRLTTLDELPELDLTVDGADELDPICRSSRVVEEPCCARRSWHQRRPT